MKFSSGFVSTVCKICPVILCLVTITTSRTWCQHDIQRNWRFPPPPPPPPHGPPPPPSYILPFRQWRPPPSLKSGRPLITLYEHFNHNGIKFEQILGQRCYNLPPIIEDKASSINTNGRCVQVCREFDCKFCKTMKPGSAGHFKLSEIKMDDVISSIKPCGQIYD